MGVPRIADHAPPACSACFTQQVEQRHIDYDAAWDGPTLPAGDTVIAIDDLIICESCMIAGARLLGLQDWAESHEIVDALRAQVAAADEQLAAQQAYVDQLEKAVAAKPDSPARARSAAR
jgi:hypothetical protein